MAVVGSFIKQPTEEFDVDVDYTDRLPGAAVLSSGVLAATDLTTGADVSGTVLGSTSAQIVDDVKALAYVQAGTDGRDYKITFTVTLDNGRIFEDELIMQVREN